MKIYTKKGDQGKTSLVDGSKVTKSDLRLETYGTVDELNSHLGLLISTIESEEKLSTEVAELKDLQIWLFQLGSQLACADPEVSKNLPSIGAEQITKLEVKIDLWEKQLPALKNFILPGGHLGSSQAHICRTICRRAERSCVLFNQTAPFNFPAIAFLNRASDYFFVLARIINHKMSIPNIEWTP